MSDQKSIDEILQYNGMNFTLPEDDKDGDVISEKSIIAIQRHRKSIFASKACYCQQAIQEERDRIWSVFDRLVFSNHSMLIIGPTDVRKIIYQED